MFCASCGIAGADDVKLMKCTGCYLVRYCSVKCQKEHRPQHKKECKKRAAELRDEILFKQPENTHFEDCPICCLPLIEEKDSALWSCCCKRICEGCLHANVKVEIEGKLDPKCPFCRTPLPKDEEHKINYMKRAEANDPIGLCGMGKWSAEKGYFDRALEYFTKAVALGDIEAHFYLSQMYHDGDGVEKDEKKELYHLEEAAIGGHTVARHNLGCVEVRRGSLDRAIKHCTISANMGYRKSLESLAKLCRDGLVSKEDFVAALLAHQAAIRAAKSPQREEAANFFVSSGYYDR